MSLLGLKHKALMAFTIAVMAMSADLHAQTGPGGPGQDSTNNKAPVENASFPKHQKTGREKAADVLGAVEFGTQILQKVDKKPSKDQQKVVKGTQIGTQVVRTIFKL